MFDSGIIYAVTGLLFILFCILFFFNKFNTCNSYINITICIFFLCSSIYLLYNIIYFIIFESCEYIYDCYIIIILTMLLILVNSIIYCIAFSSELTLLFIIYCFCIFFSGIFFLFSETIAEFFFTYELLLLPTCMIVLQFAKTQRAFEAFLLFVFITQFGVIFLFFLIGGLCADFNVLECVDFISDLDIDLQNILVFVAFITFGTKIPVWPFYYWLPEAHVEVPTSFSIVLSGLTIKFAVFGLIRFFMLTDVYIVSWFLCFFLCIGFIDSLVRMDLELDLKKIVAYQTVAEMHLLLIFLSFDFELFSMIFFFFIPGHCWISTLNFILVDMIARRYGTRNICDLYGIGSESPLLSKLILYCVFIFGTIPGTLIFSVECYIGLFSSYSLLSVLLFFAMQFIYNIASRSCWWNVIGGDCLHINQPSFSLTRGELLFICFCILQMCVCCYFICFIF